MALRCIIPSNRRGVFITLGASGAGIWRDTEFADMRAAYDALDDATKALVKDLITEHSIAFSRNELGFSDYPEGMPIKCVRYGTAWCAHIR